MSLATRPEEGPPAYLQEMRPTLEEEEEEEGIRIFSWTAPVVEAAPQPPPTRGARWKPGDSDDDEEEWRLKALDMAVDAEKIRAQAPMLQAGRRIICPLPSTKALIQAAPVLELDECRCF
jgi:hypothetical protein